MLPPTFSWLVRSIFTPRSWNSRASERWTIVAPTCDLMSSPTIGRPAFLKRLFQYCSRAMNTGMQFTNPQPASRICSTYHFVASSDLYLPVGSEDATKWYVEQILDVPLRRVLRSNREVEIGRRDEVVRRADPRRRLRVRELHPGIHRARAVLEQALQEGRPADRRR